MKRSKKPKETRAEKRARKANDKAVKKAEKAREKAAKKVAKKESARSKTSSKFTSSSKSTTISTDVTIGHEKNVKVIDESELQVSKVPVTIDTDDSKGSRFVQQAQDYAGAGMGSHYPSHKGAEVAAVSTEGDPNRPMILGQVPNSESDSDFDSKQDFLAERLGDGDSQRTGMTDSGDANSKWQNVIVDRGEDAFIEPQTVQAQEVIVQDTTDDSGLDMSLIDNVQIKGGLQADGPLGGLGELDLNQNLWDGMRVLVPVDVQALVVPPTPQIQEWANLETNWEVKQPTTSPKSINKNLSHGNSLWAKAPLAFEKKVLSSQQMTQFSGEAGNAFGRPAGIHLHWAMPDALMRGSTISDDTEPEYLNLDDNICGACGNSWPSSGSSTLCPECNSGNVMTADAAARSNLEVPHETEADAQKNLNELFTFPQLPNRWLVVRSWGNDPQVPLSSKAWIIESETLNVTPLEQWSPTSMSAETNDMTAIGPNSGDINWMVTYDNSEGRFTFHDTPEDNVVGPLNYFVSGWYDAKERDPLWCSANKSQPKWWEQLAELGWSLDQQHVTDKVDQSMIEEGISWLYYSSVLTSGGTLG